MKTKQIAFKNPFDLIDEEVEPMSIPTADRHNKYIPPITNTHTPLPFNPYEITREEPVKYVPKVEHQPQPSYFIPPQPKSQSSRQESQSPVSPEHNNYYSEPHEHKPPKQYVLDENGDPPLLDDIGIQPQKIKERILLVVKLGQPTYDIIHDPDLSGPILIGLTLGCLLLFAGKIHFGDIYAMFILGNLLVYFLLNLLSQNQIVPLYSIMSTMGYGLLPMLGLGAVGVFISLKGALGIAVGLGAAFWASYSAGNFMDVLIKDSKNRKALVIYPLFLFYVSFTMIVIF